MTAWTRDHFLRLRFRFRTPETRSVFPSRPLAQGLYESFRPYQQRDNVICFMCGRKGHFRRCVIGSPGCSNPLNVKINVKTARLPLNDEYFYDFDEVSDKYIQIF